MVPSRIPSNPKIIGCVAVDGLHPLVLQNTAHKWLAPVLCLQLEDLVASITLMEQKAFIKHRKIFENLWQAFGTWDMMRDGRFCPIDFKKAVDSVTPPQARPGKPPRLARPAQWHGRTGTEVT